MPPVKGQMFKYSQDDLRMAYDDVKRGASISSAAKKYNVPYSTLHNKVHNKTPLERRMGRENYLTDEHENILVTWIITMAKAGFPITIEQLQDSVCKIVTELKIVNPFKNNRPGRHWFEAFSKRHPEITLRTAQNLTESRAAVTKDSLLKWFAEVESYLKDTHNQNIIKDPRRVFNCDETAFFLNPSGNKVLAAKGDKTVYQKVNSNEKECLTVLLTGNASGDLPPPMIVFQYERIPRDLAFSIPNNWGIGRSENGWMTGETFFEYITNVFDPWLNQNNIPKPVVLFIDGHASHLTLHTSKFCSEHGIVLVALYPNATHLIQPMDVAVFHSLKSAWREAVKNWRMENLQDPRLRKVHFAPLLNKIMDQTLKKSLFESGFRTTGLYPWNPNAVELMKKTKTKSKREQINKIGSTELREGLAFIEKFIDKEKLTMFKQKQSWTGKIEDKSLFEFWSLIKNKCDDVANLHIQAEEDATTPMDNDNADPEIISFIEPDSFILTTSEAQIISPSLITERFLNHSEVTEVLTTLVASEESFVHTTPSKLNPVDSIISKEITTISSNADTLTAQRSPKKNKVPELNATVTSEKTSHSETVQSTGIVEASTSTTITGDTSIPTPFKRLLFWPIKKEKNLKKRKTEKVPAVASGKMWLDYHVNKEKKKSDALIEKQKKAEERKKKKEEKVQQKKCKINVKRVKQATKKLFEDSSSDDDFWVASGKSTDDYDSDDLNIF